MCNALRALGTNDRILVLNAAALTGLKEMCDITLKQNTKGTEAEQQRPVWRELIFYKGQKYTLTFNETNAETPMDLVLK